MRQVANVVALICLLISCSTEVKERVVAPKPKSLEVGQHGHFTLDSQESSAAIRSGVLDVTVTSVTETEVGLEGIAKVKTLIGPKDFNVVSSLEAGIVTREFLSQLRDVKTHQAKNAVITYVGLTKDACDTVRLTEIVGYPALDIEPTICVQTGTIPRVVIYVKESGQVFTATFLADE